MFEERQTTINEYFHHIKQIVDNLAAVGSPVNDDDIVVYVLNGLPDDYGPFTTYIRVRSDPTSTDELHNLLLSEELAIELKGTTILNVSAETTTQAFSSVHSSSQPSYNQDSSSGSTTKHNFSNDGSSNSSYTGYGRGNGRNNSSRGRGRRRNNGRNSGYTPCQICHKSGHQAIDCWYRLNHSYPGRVPPSKLAMMARSTIPTSTTFATTDIDWYLDSGANNHITPDLTNIYYHTDYKGPDKVMVGNGQAVGILKTGSSLIKTPYISFKLKNILHIHLTSQPIYFL
ncbi:Retrovirus-related pol polyprotein from transposon re1 [Thalictrum thalictroides]|uniref:Retrovirus-related pol polyprotein from transposon re1 n=1 Tax=Thalictrum thalictroides TaxID=46969 RepID=A0A7J6VT14_THATH|nr:Retrovirus-related pol polyprotein from transposon re1 [Thalictrum thalictroides]